jgi:non-ribosomal peptide synthetase component F
MRVDRSEAVVVGGEAELRRENRRLIAQIQRLRLTLLDCAREVGEDISDAHHELTTPLIEALALEAVSRFREACEHDARDDRGP